MDGDEWTALFDRAAGAGATEGDVREALAAVRGAGDDDETDATGSDGGSDAAASGGDAAGGDDAAGGTDG